MSRLPRHPCPVCGRRIAATTTSLYAARRDGKLIRYVYLRPHNNSQGPALPRRHRARGSPDLASSTHQRKDHAMTEPPPFI